MESSLKYVIIPIFLILILSEVVWSVVQKKGVYHPKETLSNIFIMLVNQLLKPLVVFWNFKVFAWVAGFQFFSLPDKGWVYIVAVVFVDFLFYWQHRLSHEVKFLWTLHNVHHSSPWMNFTTAFRINWLGGFLSPLFYLPAILLGFSAEQVTFFLIINLVFQFLMHTEAIGKIPLLEGWINTPSAHRVHHGSNDVYLDKNYGGVLLIWDRLFGTYQPETEKVVYGVTTGFRGHNPVKAVFGPVIQYFRGEFHREKELRK
ncbi:MAG: sterol desaturase family protein [Bacteroidia bacterium]|nr:sterol desaturase family protein [Bacteroidia bacterium]